MRQMLHGVRNRGLPGTAVPAVEESDSFVGGADKPLCFALGV